MSESDMSVDWSSFGISQRRSLNSFEISNVEKSLGVNFPKLYLDLVAYADEASPEISSFTYGDNETCISDFFSFSAQQSPYSISWYLGLGGPPGLPKGRVPIARDAGGYLICLNFNTVSVSVEIFVPDSERTYFVANSFDEFVKLWYE
ncbi:SMI1/KNR4 family protein [Pseudomonas sp. SDO528_S397]